MVKITFGNPPPVLTLTVPMWFTRSVGGKSPPGRGPSVGKSVKQSWWSAKTQKTALWIEQLFPQVSETVIWLPV